MVLLDTTCVAPPMQENMSMSSASSSKASDWYLVCGEFVSSQTVCLSAHSGVLGEERRDIGKARLASTELPSCCYESNQLESQKQQTVYSIRWARSVAVV
eukprot:1038681-Amphidinium_carterae.1